MDGREGVMGGYQCDCSCVALRRTGVDGFLSKTGLMGVDQIQGRDH